MNRISNGLSMSLMVKSDFHHIWLCVKPLDGKVGQTTALDWPHVVGVFMVVFWSITTFILTKQSFHSLKSKDTRMTNLITCKNNQWKRFIGFETIPSMFEVIFLLLVFFTSCRGDKFLELFHLTRVCISPHSPCRNSKTQAWGMYAVSIATLFWPPTKTHLSTPSPHLRKVTLPGFGFRWIGTMKFNPCFELWKE